MKARAAKGGADVFGGHGGGEQRERGARRERKSLLSLRAGVGGTQHRAGEETLQGEMGGDLGTLTSEAGGRERAHSVGSSELKAEGW